MFSDQAIYVDVIIPTYNRAHLVGQAIQSVLEQSYPHVRVLVVDDASSDQTARILSRFESERVTAIRSSRNLGVTGAKNLGLDHLQSSSAYFGILDSDDTLQPEAIARLVRGFELDGYSQVLGRCRETGTSRIVSMLDGAPLEHMQVIGLRDAMEGRISGEYWHLARTDMARNLRFESRARGGESLLWHRLLRESPALLLPVDVRSYDTTGFDRVSLGQYSRHAAYGKMWAYRCYIDEFEDALPRQRFDTLLREAAKYALLAGDLKFGLQALRRLNLPAEEKLKIVAWPAHARIRQLQSMRSRWVNR